MISRLVVLLALAAGWSAAGEQHLIGYFPNWGVYQRGYTVKQVELSGAAERLDVLVYAFATIGPDLRAALGDAHADHQQAYDAGASVDGVADGGPGTLRGSFNQLRKLKLRHPRLKVLLAVGGWNGSERFSDAALTVETRRAFATSCIELAIDGRFAPGLRHPGLFDGIDIDWEFPGAPGASGRFRAEDGANFTALLAELRAQLDRRGAADGRRYLLSAAVPAAPALAAKLELPRIHGALDAIHLMSYDFRGGWDATTGHQAGLHAAPDDPPAARATTVAQAVGLYRAAGVPAAKLILGVPFYGRGWSGVEPGARNDGLGQRASGEAPAARDYRLLKDLPPGFAVFRDPRTRACWSYDAQQRQFWSFDDAETLRAKAAYAAANGLGGVMCWQLGGDDDAGTLIRALRPDPLARDDGR